MFGTSAKRQKVARTQILVEASHDSSEFNLTALLRRDRNEARNFCDFTISHKNEKIALHKCLFGTMFRCFDDLFCKVNQGSTNLEMKDGNKFQGIKKMVDSFYNGNVDPENCEKAMVKDLDKNSLDDLTRHRLNSDRLEWRKFCDFTISTGTRDFPVHKSIVAVQCDYFTKLFTTNMKEKHQSICHIDEIDNEIIVLVLDFIYTKKIWVNENMFSDMLTVTDYFCMKAFNDEIVNCMVGLVSDDNCVKMWITGKKFEKANLMQRAGQEICANALLAITSDQLYNIEPIYIEDFMKLIKEKVSDDQLLKCALIWIKHDMNNRMEKFEMFYNMIETKSLSQSTWALLINTEELVHHNTAAANAVIPYMRQFVPSAETELALGMMYVMSGTGTSGNVYRCDMSLLKPQTSDNKSCFFPRWEKLPVQKFGIDSTMICCSQTLYVVGGSDMLSFHESWKSLVRLKEYFEKPAVAFVGGTFYFTNGYYAQNSSLGSWKMNDQNGQVTTLASTKFGRSGSALVPYRGFLFAIGRSKSRKFPKAAPIEIYSIQSNTWSTLPETRPDIFDVKMTVVHHNKAYIVYGENTIQVATFDLAQRQWVPEKSAETGIVERCASLTLGVPEFVSCTMGPAKTR